MLWVTQQADGLDVSIIGVERLPAKYVSVYSYMPINITVRGDYNPLGRFISNLERSPNMVRIDSFRIKRKEHTPEQVVMELSLSYFQRAEGS
jgi:Tfp pilus assembly protein PilO